MVKSLTNFNILIILIIISSSICYAQKKDINSISGVIIEYNTQKAIQYATISLYRKVDSALITGCIADSLGQFKIIGLKEIDYYLNVSALGFQKKSIVIHYSKDLHLFDVGKIALDIKDKVLNDIIIREEKNNIVIKSDRKILKVENSIAASGGSAAEILQALPEIKITGNKITLKGQSFTVLIDDKPSGITSEQLLQYPASSIASIEVITNPSAKYSPEGLGGIVNLRLKKNTSGLNSVIQLSGGSDNSYNSAATINYNIGKFRFFASANENYWGVTFTGYLNKEIYDVSLANETIAQKVTFLKYNFKAGFDFDLNASNLFTFYWSQPNDNGNSNNGINSTTISNQSVSRYDADIDNHWKVRQNEFALSYIHLFPQKGTKFTIDINQFSSNTTKKVQPDIKDDLPVFSETKYALTPQNTNNTANVQCNFVWAVNSKIKFESGLNIRFKQTKDENSGATYNFTAQDWIDSMSIKNTFNYNELVSSGYALMTTSWKKIEFQLGVRKEYTDTKNFLANSDTLYRQKYASLFPSANISYTLTESLNMSLSYSRRINRPSPSQLNPFITPGIYLSEEYEGNSSLKPAYTNSYEFNISQEWKKLFFYLTFSYMQSSDVVEQISSIADNGITVLSYTNLNTVKDYMVNSSLNWKTAAWLRFDLSGEFYKEDINNLEIYQSHYLYDFSLKTRFSLKNDWKINLDMYYYAPIYDYFAKIDAQYLADIRITKNISDRFMVSLRLNDIFDSKFVKYSWSESYTSKTYTDNHTRSLYFGIMYKFGKEIKTRARLNVTDIKMQR